MGGEDVHMTPLETAIAEAIENIKREVATRSKDNGPKVNEYNSHVIFGLNLAKAFILEELKRVDDD
jgi:hypothetical protein